MSRVFVSSSTGAAVYVFSDDHCPPHVHARHRSDGWVARIGFSYISEVLTLMSIAPTQRIPNLRLINKLLADVQMRLRDCRKCWWITMQTTCLERRSVLVGASGVLKPITKHHAGAKQIASAAYDPVHDRLSFIFVKSSHD